MKKLFLFSIITLAIALMSAPIQAATSWYFPEGCTRGFDLWILVVNTNDTDASVKYTFYLGSISTPVTHTETVEANKRKTIKVNDYVGDNEDVSTKVECTNGLNIYAERAMYWSESTFPTWQGGHTSRGIRGVEGCYTEISQPSSFPITISSSGSYKLTGNISCSTEDVNAITITASDVTLDLNGFTITGPGATAGSSGNGIYIYASGSHLYNVTIKNGAIKDFKVDGIQIIGSGGSAKFYGVIIEKCQAYNNGDDGIFLAGYTENCIIRDNIAYGNTTSGIYVGALGGSSRNRVERNHCVNGGSWTDLYLDNNSSNTLCINNSVGSIVNNGTANQVTNVANQGNTDLIP